MKKNGGFTLIELMTVVIVIAVLAALAIPSYLKQVRKARRSDVEGIVQQIALLEERFRADCTTYAGAFGATCTGTTMKFATLASLYTGSYYNITLSNGSAVRYTITATPTTTGGQNRDDASGTSCNPLTYDFNTGVTTKTPSVCWSR